MSEHFSEPDRLHAACVLEQTGEHERACSSAPTTRPPRPPCCPPAPSPLGQ
ncbi:MAG TPA: hypothetical protein VEU33_48130 [Archangium sp.]|nr:hypothetical protein [Archangium sp.]